MNINFLKQIPADVLHSAFCHFFTAILGKKLDDYSQLVDGTLIANYLRLELGEKPSITSTDLHSFEPPQGDPQHKEFCNWIYIGHYVAQCWAKLNPKLPAPIDITSIAKSRFGQDDRDCYLSIVMLMMYFDVTRKGNWQLYLQRRGGVDNSGYSGHSMPKPEETVEGLIKEIMMNLMFSNVGYFIPMLEKLRSVNETMGKDIKASKASMQNMMKTLGNSQLVSYNLERDVKVLMTSNKEKDETIKDLERKIVLLTQENKLNTKGRIEFQKETEELREILEQKSSELSRCKEKLMDMQALAEKYRMDYEGMIVDNEKREIYGCIIENMKKENHALKENYAELEKYICELTDKNMDMSKSNLELQLRIKDLENVRDRIMRQAEILQKTTKVRSELFDSMDFKKKQKIELYGQDLVKEILNSMDLKGNDVNNGNFNQTYMYRLLCIELAKELQAYFKELYDMVLYFEVLKDDEDMSRRSITDE